LLMGMVNRLLQNRADLSRGGILWKLCGAQRGSCSNTGTLPGTFLGNTL
jgi:hypothetical protein